MVGLATICVGLSACICIEWAMFAMMRAQEQAPQPTPPRTTRSLAQSPRPSVSSRHDKRELLVAPEKCATVHVDDDHDLPSYASLRDH